MRSLARPWPYCEMWRGSRPQMPTRRSKTAIQNLRIGRSGAAPFSFGYGVHLLAEALVPVRIPLGSEFAKASSPLRGIDSGQICPDGLVHRLADSLAGESSPGLERPIGSLVEVANSRIHVCIVTHVCVMVKTHGLKEVSFEDYENQR